MNTSDMIEQKAWENRRRVVKDLGRLREEVLGAARAYAGDSDAGPLLAAAKDLRIVELEVELYRARSELIRSTFGLEDPAGMPSDSLEALTPELVQKLATTQDFDDELHMSGVIEHKGGLTRWHLVPFDACNQSWECTDHRCECSLVLEDAVAPEAGPNGGEPEF